jgi:peptidoglycan-associated lipoprotein
MKKLLLLSSLLLVLAGCANDDMDDSEEWMDGRRADGSIVPGTQADLHYNVGDTVYFPYDSSSVDHESKELLKKQASWLKEHNKPVIIEGHCDQRGTREYNIALGERRATAAKNYLLSLGVDASMVDTISYGKERPAVVGHGEEVWAKNRRAVTVIAK